MRVYYPLHLLSGTAGMPSLGPAVLTIGAFDGVHIGHRRLLERAGELARERGVSAVAITFWPHPLHVLQPEQAVELLTTLDERLNLFAGIGTIDAVVVLPFTPELASMEPDAFLDLLATFCTPVALVEGLDFAFGQRQAGDMAYLHVAGDRRGFVVETQDVQRAGARVSSTQIREFVMAGRVDEATLLLGHPYTVTGNVVDGDHRGRLLGFPTANLHIDTRKILPSNGVYAVCVRLPGERLAEHPGVCNIGVRPTFGGEPRLLVEVHLLDATIDLYGLSLEVAFVSRLRDERRFSGVAELTAQIGVDAQRARDILEGHSGSGASGSLGTRSSTSES